MQSVYDNTDKAIKIVLVGNKIDLPREVSTEEGRKLAEYYKVPFYETSAKDNVGIHECVRTLLTEVLQGFERKTEGVKLDGNNSNNGDDKKCKC